MKRLLRRLFGGGNRATQAQSAQSESAQAHTSNSSTDAPSVVIISGLPRSGTSMMMKMLEAGGLSVLIDGLRAADTDNPEGYYELERVKGIDKGDAAWLPDAVGKGVKVISALLQYLPPDYTYQVIFIHRQVEEVLRSQRKMLRNRGEDDSAVDDAEMAELFAKHVDKTLAWIKQQPNFNLLEIHYSDVLADPQPQASAINQFLGNTLDERAMTDVVNPDLYRNRATL